MVRLKTQALWARLSLLGRSQNWLAREVGLSPGYLSTLVNEERAPSGRIRRRMQRVLGVETSMSCSSCSAGTMARSASPRLSAYSEGLAIHARPVPCGSGELPRDFVKRLNRLKKASGLTWNEFSEALGVELKQVLRWRRRNEPCGGAYHCLVGLAPWIPGGLDILMGEDFLKSILEE